MLRSLMTSGMLLSVVSSGALAAPLYSIKDLTPEGYTSSTAYDINSSGDAVGVAGSPSGEAFFYYDHATGTSTVFGVGTVSPRGTIEGTGFREAAINDSGTVAATAMFVGGVPYSRGFIYNGSTFVDLGTFYFGAGTGSGIRPASDALDINSSGVAVGTATSGAAIPEGVDTIDIYTGTSAPITDIDGDYTVATRFDFGRAMNDAGLIAGSNQDSKATLFSGATETVFLSATSLAAVSSVATDLNEVGQVTGHTVDNTSFIYDTTDSSLRILPNLNPAAGRVLAKAINESGDVVGWGDRGASLDDQARGFVHIDGDDASYILEDYTVFTGSTDPGLGDWEKLRTAWGINDDGWIVGVGDRRFDGATFPTNRAYLLIPVPEPTSLVLIFLIGIAPSTARMTRKS